MSSSGDNDNAENMNLKEDDGIENLLRQLHGQIKSSNWLETNTAVKLEEENPELIKAWKTAIEEPKQ